LVGFIGFKPQKRRIKHDPFHRDATTF